MNRSLFLLCHATPDDTRVIDIGRDGWVHAGERRVMLVKRVLAFQMNKQLFWLWRFLFKSSVVCFFSANLHSHNVSNSNPKEVVLFPGRACNYRCTG